MRALNVLLSLLVCVVLFVLVFEGGLRLIGFGPPSNLLTFDSALGWTKKADYSWRRTGKEFDITIETNELGLRDDPMSSKAKPDGVFRVVMLGDSFTLGFTVDREDLFVDLLEGKWKDEGRSIEILNAGTQAYSTDQEVRWLQEHGAELDPDLVVLLPYDNDIFWNSQPEYAGRQKPMYAADGTLETTEPFVEPAKPWHSGTAIGNALFKSSPSNPTFTAPGGRKLPADFAPLFDERPAVVGDSFERTRGAFAALQQTCAELGCELLVAPIPSHAAIDDAMAQKFSEDFLGVSTNSWSPDRPVDLWVSACAAADGVACIDARDALRAATNNDESCYFDFFGPDREWHFNARGNRVFAEALHAQMDALGIVPPAANDGEWPTALAASTEGGGGLPTWMIVFAVLWLVLTGLYLAHYPDEPKWQPPLKVGGLLAMVFTIVLGGGALIGSLPAEFAQYALLGFLVIILGFVAWKLGNRLATIAELFKAFVLRGHWYLMPLVVILLTIGSLLVVAASSPLVAPFIYTLF